MTVLLLCCFVLLAAFGLAWGVASGVSIADVDKSQLIGLAVWVLGIKICALHVFQQFSVGISFFSVPDLRRILMALGISAGITWGVGLLQGEGSMINERMIIADFSFALIGVCGVRLALRCYRERTLGATADGSDKKMVSVGIVGAGDAGASLARELVKKPRLGLNPVAFFDDDPEKWRINVHGIPVYGPPEMLLANGRFQPRLDQLVIAMPSAPSGRIKELVNTLHPTKLRVETIPSLDQLATGQVKVTHLRPIEIEDLLGRDPVKLEMENIMQVLQARRVMVTGAGGSIGAELCRQIATYDPLKLVLVERCESQMFPIEEELVRHGHKRMLASCVADILDERRMRKIFEEHRPEIVFHAAAHKHVPLMESQPGEAIRNNTMGTLMVAELSKEFDAERFVLISTDKAINPTSVMGASKRLAEMLVQSLNHTEGNATKFMAVRFGNVLGSSGSVVPLFKQQIASGGPVKVTHPEVTRYFMTIPEAVSLVLQSAALGDGGEIFVLDMGRPVKIVDLARQLIRLSGLRPNEDIAIEYVGLRPGEKMFEEILCKGENTVPTPHPMISCLVGSIASFERLRSQLHEELVQLEECEPLEMKRWIQHMVPEYVPYVKGLPRRERTERQSSLVDRRSGVESSEALALKPLSVVMSNGI